MPIFALTSRKEEGRQIDIWSKCEKGRGLRSSDATSGAMSVECPILISDGEDGSDAEPHLIRVGDSPVKVVPTVLHRLVN